MLTENIMKILGIIITFLMLVLLLVSECGCASSGNYYNPNDCKIIVNKVVCFYIQNGVVKILRKTIEVICTENLYEKCFNFFFICTSFITYISASHIRTVTS